jgi:sulfatase maturation enzyme AslB (radical SAM superfamily)
MQSEMQNPQTSGPLEYLVGEGETLALTPQNEVVPLPQGRELGDLTKKERAMRSNGFIITDESGKAIFTERTNHSQHFFPLTGVDYAKALYEKQRNKKPIPILSVDSHDVLRCDFGCQDCLSVHGTGFPTENFPQNNFEMDIVIYKAILKEIAEFSERRGFKEVRFEQSGEGNPDYYAARAMLLRCARELGMQSVYITSGSKMNEELRESLVQNAAFIRISFPGIGDAYTYYSRQTRFTYQDALRNLEKIVRERKKAGRERELMVGARLALRQKHEETYLDFASKMRDIGIDGIQIVKIVAPEGSKLQEFPLTPKSIENLERTKELDSPSFNVRVPYTLDYMVYLRNVYPENFPKHCLSALFQPVLAGRSLFACTISHVMYEQDLRLGTFEGTDQEIERFMSTGNLRKVMRDVPRRCNSCSNIYDNILLSRLQGTFGANSGKLKFYEIIK